MGKLTYDDQTGEPKDTKMIVYFTAILCGTAMLLPYNAFIAVPPYVEKYYAYASDSPGYNTTMPQIWNNIENYLLVASLVPNFLAQLSMLSSWGRSLRIFPRLVMGIFFMIFAVLSVIIVPLFKVEEGVALFTLIGATVLVNVAAAIFQASMFSFAAFFPFHVTQGLMLGVGLSGTTASIMATTIRAAMLDTFTANQHKASIYFGLAALILFSALISLLFLRRNPYAQYYCTEFRSMEYTEDEQFLNSNGTDFGTSAAAASAMVASNGGGQENSNTSTPKEGTSPKTPKTLTKEDKSLSTLTTTDSVMMFTDVPYVLKLIAPMIGAVFWVYMVSLFVFPSFGVKLHSGGWFGVLIILMFNVGDFSGRFLCRFPVLLLSRKMVLVGCGARTLLVIFFFLQVPANAIDSVAFAYVLMYVIGLTNGYYSTQVMMLAPQTQGLMDDGDRGVCGNAMSVALLGGAAAGSLISLAVVPQL